MHTDDRIRATLQLKIPDRLGSSDTRRIDLAANAVEPVLERDRSNVLGL